MDSNTPGMLDPVDPTDSDNCDVIVVEQTVSNDLCNGRYQRDPETQRWVNENDPQCVLQKIYDSNTGAFRWAFSVQTPEGTPPPPGAKKIAAFHAYPGYVESSGVYFKRLVDLFVWVDRHLPADGVNWFPESRYNSLTDKWETLKFGHATPVPVTKASVVEYHQGLPLRVDVGPNTDASRRDLSAVRTRAWKLFPIAITTAGTPIVRYLVDENLQYERISSQYPVQPAVTDVYLKPLEASNNYANAPLVTAGYDEQQPERSGFRYRHMLEYTSSGYLSEASSSRVNTDFCPNTWQDIFTDETLPATYAPIFYPSPFAITRITPTGTPFAVIAIQPDTPSDFYNHVKNADPKLECAWTGWYLDLNIGTASSENESCPADADWSGTGISVTRPDGSGGGSDPGNGDPGNGDPGNGHPGNGDPVTRAPYTGTTIASKYKGWVFDERTSAISGPFVHEDVTAISTKDNSAEMFCVTEDKEVKKTDLLEFNNYEFPPFNDPFTDILTPFDGSTTKGIVLSETAEGFCYRNKFLPGPFEDSRTYGGTVQNPLYFRNSYLAQSETNWMHLGDEHSEKQCYRVDLRFHKNSCGHLWLYVKNDFGLVKGQYKGPIQEHMKVFTNLRGRAFKIHMLVATHHDHPWAMREMAIGHLYGKSF